MNTRCGTAGVIGLPNAGKSTLVNALVGAKVSIVSRKQQTTRTTLMGIALYEEAQILLIDTPGIFKPKKTLEKAMVGAALSSFEGTDCILHIVDAALKNPVQDNRMVFESLKGRKAVLVLNKIDKVKKENLLKIAADLNAAFPYEAVFMISALQNTGTADLLSYLHAHMPKSAWMYPEDQISDMPVRVMASEITREKIFDLLHEELPYAIHVETESWEAFQNGDIKISQIIYVQKQSQKGIVLGKGGGKIKAIGQAAREEIAALLEQKVHLKLFVRVQENWPERAEFYRSEL